MSLRHLGRHEEIDLDRNLLATDDLTFPPDAGVLAAPGMLLGEVGCSHRALDQRLGADLARVEAKIGVRGVGGHAELGVSGVLVHGLSADQHEGVTVLGQGLQGVEEHPPCGDVELVVVYPWG